MEKILDAFWNISWRITFTKGNLWKLDVL